MSGAGVFVSDTNVFSQKTCPTTVVSQGQIKNNNRDIFFSSHVTEAEEAKKIGELRPRQIENYKLLSRRDINLES